MSWAHDFLEVSELAILKGIDYRRSVRDSNAIMRCTGCWWSDCVSCWLCELYDGLERLEGTAK